MRTILPDKLTGIQASQAITAALLARERTGKGQHVRLSMLDTVVSFLWSSDMGEHTFVGAESERERAQSWIDLIYETRDGFITVAVNQNKEWESFAHAPPTGWTYWTTNVSGPRRAESASRANAWS